MGVVAAIVVIGAFAVGKQKGLFDQQEAETASLGSTSPGSGSSSGQASGGTGAQNRVSWSKKGTYGAWEVRCRDDAPNTCGAVLQVINKETKQTLLAWTVGANNQGKMQSLIQTPTGVLIGRGVELKLDAGPTRRIGFLNCEPGSCRALANMDESFLGEARTAEKAKLTIYASDGRGINFDIPLSGLKDALLAIQG
jgi:invasion protein IalB